METKTHDTKLVKAPKLKDQGFVAKFATGVASLLKGMKVTISYFSRPSTIVTQQYPENRATLKMFDRARIQLTMIHDENGYHKCTACGICEQACPNGSITVLGRKGVTGKEEIDHYLWRMDSCTFCNMCVIACPFGTLKMADTFENAVYDRRLLMFNLNHYAGPTGPNLMKIADPEERKKLVEPREPYSGPVALRGASIAGIRNEEFRGENK